MAEQRNGGADGYTSRWSKSPAERRSRIGGLLSGALVASSAAVLSGSVPTLAAIDDTRCLAEPTTSIGVQSGVTAVAVGEQVRVGAEVDLDAGVVYQDILANPDGTTYVSTFIAVTPAAGGAPAADAGSLALTIDGAPQTLTPGTLPSPDGFVLDSAGGDFKVYFPGDPAVLAAPTGTAAPSYTVPDGGQTFRLTYQTTVGELEPGEVTPVAHCRSAISYGDANAVVGERAVAVAALGLELTVAKSADLPVLAPDTTVSYSIDVVVPETDATGELRNGTAFDTIVTDVLPPGLVYVDGSASHGGAESEGVLQWTIAELSAGSALTLTYDLRVPADATPGATFTNSVSATTTGRPGDVPGERAFEAQGDSVTLANGASPPALTKNSDVSLAGTGETVTFTVAIDWPAGSTWHDVTITDLLPDGLTLLGAGTVACPVACPTLTALDAAIGTDGSTRFGWYVAELGPFVASETWTWTYTARMTGTFADGMPVPLGTSLENLAEVRFNLVPRLGGVLPNPARLNGYDVTIAAAAPVEFNRPVVSVDKAGPAGTIEPTPAGITYTVTLTNDGGVAATNVTFRDPGPSSGGYGLGAVSAPSVTGATYNATTGVFTVGLIPAGESREVTYSVVGAPARPTAIEGEYANTATLTGYRDPSNNVYATDLSDAATVAVAQPEIAIDKQRLSASPIAGTDGEQIVYRITLTNLGDATAFVVAGVDELGFDGTIEPGACTGGLNVSAAGELTLAELAPDAEATCEYTVTLDGDQPEGPLDNSATVTWRNGFGQTAEFTPETGVVPWTASDSASTTVVHPVLALAKAPEADTPGNVIVNGQTATYTVAITNVGQVAARNVVLDDQLPSSLSLAAAPQVESTPSGVVHTVDGASGESVLRVSIPALAPGAVVRVTIPVRHDGVVPDDEAIVNTATLMADGLDAPLADPGTLMWVPAVNLPEVSKVADPSSAGIGETVTWTVTATVDDNTVELFDVAFVDTLPRGTTFASYGTVECITGPLCSSLSVPTTLTPAVLATGETRIGWFIGDVPVTNVPTTYEFTFTSTIAATYSGTGSPAAGTSVTDTALINRVQPWLTISDVRDRYDDNTFPDLSATSLSSQFERRGLATSAPVRAVTPRVVVDKAITNLGEPFEWQTASSAGRGYMADAGDVIEYVLTVENIGGAAAHDIVVSDSMGQMPGGPTMLRDVTLAGLPTGVTVVDGWTLEDPDVVLRVDELAAGGTLTLTYTGVVAPSSELIPGYSGDNRDVALISNTVEVPEFRSAADGGGLAFADTFRATVEAYVYTPSPYIAAAAACVGGSTAPAGTTSTFAVNTRNGAPPFGETNGTLLTTGYPPDATVGVGHDTTLTIVLSAGVRYTAGTARVNGSVVGDPSTTIDAATSVQTLVFDLGDVPQGYNRNVAFQVRTIADGVQGGMVATLTMDDASGSPSRGTAVDGAAYVYQDAEARGCAPGQPLRITKVPDLSWRYDGKKQFKIGEPVQWSGAVAGGGAPYHDGEFVDILPQGIDYVPGSASFTVFPMSGSAQIASIANGNLTETITPLPDGRTELRFDSPAFAVFRQIAYRYDSVVGDDAIVGSTLTNVIHLTTSDGIVGNCGSPTVAVCDNGQIQIVSSATPTATKSVEHTAGPWGDSFTYTIDVTLPPDVAYFDAYIGDRADFPRALDPDGEPFAGATLECLFGCTGDPTPLALPVWTFDAPEPDPDELAVAWFLGDLAAQGNPRVYQITYTHTFADLDEYEAEFGEPPASEVFVNEAVAGWNDSDVVSTPADTAASSRAFAINTAPRGLDDASVNLVTPELSVTKECAALDGRDDVVTSSSFGGETNGSIPNFRCVLTATNVTDPEIATSVVDPVLVDDLPMVSTAGGRAVTAQLIQWTSDHAVIVDETEEPGSPLTPPQLSALQISALGTELAPGESISVTVDLRITAASAFWSNANLTQELTTNRLRVDSFRDTAGNDYGSNLVDTWDLVVTKPRIAVTNRAWADDGYTASLADGRPTACMAYVNKTEPHDDGVRVANLFREWCTDFKDGRGHDSLAEPPSGPPPADYVRSYGDAVPDVVLGSTERVTWAIDTAVVSPNEFDAVSVVDEVPYGFEYVPGSARLAAWSETGTTHTALADPVIGADPPVSCTSWLGFHGGGIGVAGTFNVTSGNVGQLPWTPITWTFAKGAAGAAGAFWNDNLAYLNAANRDAAGTLDTATPFDRIVRVVFDVRPVAAFEECMHTPQRNRSFRSEATVTGTTTRGAVSSFSKGWVVGVELARVEKSPDAAISPDGTTATYSIDVTITDATRLDPPGNFDPGGLNARRDRSCPGPLGDPLSTPWVGLGDITRLGAPVDVRYMATPHADFSSRLVVTDTIVDDGQYVPGSATFEMFDPWGRPFAGHLQSEQIEPITVDGRQATRVTWTFDYYPAAFSIATGAAVFPCAVQLQQFHTYPSSMRISMPLPIPDGTPDGTQHPNTAAARIDHFDGGQLVRTQGAIDYASITVRNPQPPPPTSKTAVPDEVAPGGAFEWIVEAELQAGAPWFDLGWTDTIPSNMKFLGYGPTSCVLSATAVPCSPAVRPAMLEPVSNPDGSTTIGWFAGDVGGIDAARTVRMPIRVRFVGPEVAGDELVNVVTGYSNDDDLVAELTAPADPTDFDFVGDPVSGVADVVEPALTIAKTVTSDPGADGAYQAGDTVTYSVVVTNEGDATAFDVPVSDTPDAYLTDVVTSHPSRSKGWTALDPRLEWFLATLGAGESVTLDVSGVVAGGYVQSGIVALTNTATVATHTSQPAAAETGRAYPAAQARATVPLVAPNLSIAKFAGHGCSDAAQAYTPGQPVTWCVVVANSGSAPAFNVTLTDVLPVGWSYVAGSAEVTGAPEDAGEEPVETITTAGASRLLWNLGAEVLPGTEITVLYQTTPPTDGARLDENRAIVSSTLEDGTPVPGPAPGFRAVSQAAAAPIGSGLQLAKLPDSQRVQCDAVLGCSLTWELVVVNADDLDLAGATVTDYLPADLEYRASTTAAGWDVATVGAPGSGPGGTTPVTWSGPGLFPSGSTAVFTITAAVSPGGTERRFVNHAEVAAEGLTPVANQAIADVYSVGSIGDLVWNDVDRDGRQDGAEPGMPGVAVRLLDANAQVVQSAATDASGAYVFTDLAPGTYRVRFLAPNGWAHSPTDVGDDTGDSDAATGGTTGAVDLASGIHDMTHDAGLFIPPVPAYSVTKTASASVAGRGDVITYTITFTNTGEVAYTAQAPATLTDDLSGVLDDATYNGDATSGAVYAAPQLTWTGALGIGETRTITYSVTVGDLDGGDRTLRNSVTTPPGGGGSCPSASAPASCRTETPIARYDVVKQVSTAIAGTGERVTYTLRVTNTGVVDYTADSPASFTDDLSGVLDDARYNGDVSGGATVSDGVLRWSGPLAVGATVTVTYSFTVNDTITGDGRMVNRVVTPTDGSSDPGGCPPETTNLECQTLSQVVAPNPQQPQPQPPPGPGPGELPSTGAGITVAWLTLIGGLSVALGGIVVAISRRNRRARLTAT